VPKLDEVKTKVTDDLVKQRAIEAARQKAASLDAALKSGDFDKVAKDAGLEVKTTDLIARGAPIGDLGVSPAVDTAAFALPQGGVSGPIVTDNGAAIVKVLEKKEPTAAELASAKESLKNELLTDRKNRFYATYMNKARQRMNIRINHDTIAQVVA